MVSSGHLGGVLSLWDQYESHMDEINGTRSGWGSGDSSNSSTVRSTFTCVTALLSALPRGQAWPTFQDLIYPSWPASPLKAQEGDDSMTAPPPHASTMPSRYARILDGLHLHMHLAAASLGRPGCLWLEDSMIQVRCKSALPSRAHHNDIPFPEEHEPDIHQFRSHLPSEFPCSGHSNSLFLGEFICLPLGCLSSLLGSCPIPNFHKLTPKPATPTPQPTNTNLLVPLFEPLVRSSSPWGEIQGGVRHFFSGPLIAWPKVYVSPV